MRKLRLACALALVAGVLIPALEARAAPTVLDFEIATGVHTTYPGVTGVSFPQGIEVYACAPSSCGTAHSGTRAARGQFAGEFARDPLEVVFTASQSIVSLYVRSDEAARAPAVSYSATLRAYDASNAQVDVQTIGFQSNATWQLMTVGGAAEPAVIRRIVLSGGETGFTTNFIAVDDVSFEGEVAPPPPEDTEPPVITIVEPGFGEVRTAYNVDVDISVTDNMSLRVVDGAIKAPDMSVVAPLDFCGSSFSGTCPAPPSGSVFFNPPLQNVSLPTTSPNGTYTVEIRACDNADNCDLETRNFTLNVEAPPPATDVTPFRAEINQGVQRVLHSITGPGTIEPFSSAVPIFREKTTVLRYYLLGEGGTSPGFTARLRVSGERTDGSTFARNMNPNAGGSADVPEDPVVPAERDELLRQMRAQPGSSLNFVLPGSFMENVRVLDLQLNRSGASLGGRLQERPQREARLGINLVYLQGPGVGEAPRPTEDELNTVLTYLRQSYPVAEVRILSRRSYLVFRGGIWEAIMGHCGFMLESLWWTFGGDDSPVASFTSDPNIISVMGFAPADSIDEAGGCAYVGDPTDDDDRIGGTFLSEPFGSTAAQEIGHNMGLIHASNSHGEADGGDSESWTYPHGTVGDDNFGVRPTATEEPTDTSLGQWGLGLIDPCLAATIDERNPMCSLADDLKVHDFMSYGPRRWVSDITYNRLDAAISHRIPPYARVTSAGADDDRVDTLTINGAIGDDGSAVLLPLLRRDLPETMTHDEPGGSHTLRLFGDGGVVLFERDFEPVEVTVHSDHFHSLRQVVPYIAGVERVVVEEAGVTVIDETASANAPTVTIDSPNGGETLSSGVHTATWTGSDADGDDLSYLVQFSPDGGWSWQGIGFVTPGGVAEADFDVSELIPGRWGIIRVVASDGINIAVDESDFFLSVGTSAAPATSADAENAVSLRLRKHLRASGRVTSDGPPSCEEDITIVITRNGKRVKRTTTNERGRFQVRLRDRAGRYRAVARAAERGRIACSGDSSPARSHRH